MKTAFRLSGLLLLILFTIQLAQSALVSHEAARTRATMPGNEQQSTMCPISLDVRLWLLNKII